MLTLEPTANDDTTFIDITCRLIAAAAQTYDFDSLIIGHIDHWFGPRWLGFCGKFLGAAGVRSRRLTGALTPPPFHPHRIQSVRVYLQNDLGEFCFRCDASSVHGYRPSQENINRTLSRGRLYAWYSGNTVNTGKGVIMIYLAHLTWSSAWYVGFDKFPKWHLTVTKSISPSRVHELLERTASTGCQI